MTLSINNPVSSTLIFICIFLIALLFSYRKTEDRGLSISKTQELKGFAILAVIFSHIGYFLIQEHEFLFPLSVFAGVGVNMFLLLSGLGLTMSALKKEESILTFYKRRIHKLFFPFWLVLFSFLILDFFILGISYPKEFIIQSVFGIFLHANIFQDLNSPFWYITLIIFYYVLYPIFFSKKYPWISAFILYLIPYTIVVYNPSFLKDVITLYKVHLLAFPLGVLLARGCSISIDKSQLLKQIPSKVKQVYFVSKKYLYFVYIISLLGIISYFSIHSGIGESVKKEEFISLIMVFSLILLFYIKKNEYRVLSIFGLYSYEIYLLHWPIVYRYNIFYTYVPSWLATILYLFLFLGLGWVLKVVSEKVNRRK
jgi:peptidoglycan/LPS O-acetylase OafA/YrhL